MQPHTKQSSSTIIHTDTFEHHWRKIKEWWAYGGWIDANMSTGELCLNTLFRKTLQRSTAIIKKRKTPLKSKVISTFYKQVRKIKYTNIYTRAHFLTVPETSDLSLIGSFLRCESQRVLINTCAVKTTRACPVYCCNQQMGTAGCWGRDC